MKKNILLLLLLISSFSIKAQLTEGFETGVPPAGWVSFIGANGLGTENNWTERDFNVGDGDKSAYISYESVSDGNKAEDWLVTPQFTPSANANFLTFMQRQSYEEDYGTVYTIRVSTASQTTHEDFTIVDTQQEGEFGKAYNTHTVDLSAYNGVPIYVAFVMEQNDGDSWYLDNVNLISYIDPPNCATTPYPSDSATDIMFEYGVVTIAWNVATTGTDPSGYDLYLGTTSGNLPLKESTSETRLGITDLEFATTYYWKIVSKNALGSATGCPEWSFTTEDVPQRPVNDVPSGAISLKIEEGSECGENAIKNIYFGSTSDSGVAAPVCGNYGEPTSQGDLWYSFVAPSTGVLTLNTQNITNMYSVAGAYYSGTPGNLSEEGCTEFSYLGKGWPWVITGLTAGSTYYLRVWDYGNNELGSFDLCGYYSTCVAPYNFIVDNITETSVDISWTASTMTSWDLEWGEEEFIPGNGTRLTEISENAYSLTGLAEGTEYEAYVRTNCDGETTYWQGPISIKTEYSTVRPDPNVINKFDTFPGEAWYTADGDYMMPTEGGNGFGIGDFGNDAGHVNGTAAAINIYGPYVNDYLITNKYDLSGQTYYLNFDLALTQYNSTAATTFGVDDYLALFVTQDKGETWTELARWDSTSTISPTGTAVPQIELTGYNNQTVFAFYAFSDTTNADNDLFIDNFKITGVLQDYLGVGDNTIENFSLYPTLVKDKIYFTSQQKIDVFSVYNLLGQQVFSESVALKSSELNLETLTQGIYIVKVKSGNTIGSYKIIKK